MQVKRCRCTRRGRSPTIRPAGGAGGEAGAAGRVEGNEALKGLFPDGSKPSI